MGNELDHEFRTASLTSRRQLLAGGTASAALLATRLRAEVKGKIAMERCCPVVELRQYTLHPNTRDAFTALFEAQFMASQEALGMLILGVFRDLDDPDRFVWLRGFPGMELRGSALPAFYGGPVWKAHREAANAKIVDSDNVLLLRAAGARPGFDRADGASHSRPGVFLATIHYVPAGLEGPLAEFFDTNMAPAMVEDGADLLATFVTETSPNNFPRLPVRTTERVFVSFARFATEQALDLFLRKHRRRSGWRDRAAESLLPAFMRKPELIRLAPSPRSPLR